MRPAHFAPGDIVVAYRATGTQVVRLVRQRTKDSKSERTGDWLGYVLSATSHRWSKTLRPIEAASIIGSAGTEANRQQRTALREAADPSPAATCASVAEQATPEDGIDYAFERAMRRSIADDAKECAAVARSQS